MKSLIRIAGALVLLIGVSIAPGSGLAQTPSQTFPETGKTVQGAFLAYWNAHGGLAQQGYPISNEMSEVSRLNGQTYTVQYFERAVFEAHPENSPPYDILLSQLGTFRYQQKYPGGAPGQTASADNARLFPETGKTLGGKFRAYWESHGGLAQQGYPISDEFQEKSDLNGQTYTVQYFERTVFEAHPENSPPYDVLLSQVGTFQFRGQYETPPPATATAVAVPAAPTATAVPPTPDPYQCTTLPANHDVQVAPACGVTGKDLFRFMTTVLSPFEEVRVQFFDMNGQQVGGELPDRADSDGRYTSPFIRFGFSPGIWQVRITGTIHQPYGYFQLLAPPPQPSPRPKP
jgi:hypothetical protein